MRTVAGTNVDAFLLTRDISAGVAMRRFGARRVETCGVVARRRRIGVSRPVARRRSRN
jgi:hypothetical protein